MQNTYSILILSCSFLFVVFAEQLGSASGYGFAVRNSPEDWVLELLQELPQPNLACLLSVHKLSEHGLVCARLLLRARFWRACVRACLLVRACVRVRA